MRQPRALARHDTGRTGPIELLLAGQHLPRDAELCAPAPPFFAPPHNMLRSAQAWPQVCCRSRLNSMRIVDVHHRVHLQLASQLQVLVPRKRRSLSWRQRLCGWVASVRSLPCEQSIWVGIRTT